MIRAAESSDTPAVVELAVSSGLFSESEADGVRSLMDDFFGRAHELGHACLLDVDEDGLPVGVAYFQPDAATDRAWTLLMIAVRRDRQGQGRGSALVHQVEDELKRQQQRLLLVDTSGVAGFASQRRFYRQLGYIEQGRVRDYYAAGDDKVTFSKSLDEAPGPVRGVRLARRDDLDRLLELAQTFYAEDGFTTPNAVLAGHLQHMVADMDNHIAVVESDGVIVGFAATATV